MCSSDLGEDDAPEGVAEAQAGDDQEGGDEDDGDGDHQRREDEDEDALAAAELVFAEGEGAHGVDQQGDGGGDDRHEQRVAEEAGEAELAQRLDEVLYNLAESCRVLAILLNPFLPGTSAKIFAQLALPGSPDRLADAKWGGLQPGHSIGDPAPLFPRKDA